MDIESAVTLAMKFNVEELCQNSFTCARDKGWHEKPRTSCDISNLFVSELSEALEDFRAGKGINEVYYEVKFRDDGGLISKETVAAADIEAARAVEGKYGRGRSFVEAKPCGIPIEFADWVIRVGEYCGTNKLNLFHWYLVALQRGTAQKDLVEVCGFDELLSLMNYYSVLAIEHPQKPLKVDLLGQGLAVMMVYCHRAEIPIVEAINEKHAFNLTRPHRHGGKLI